MISLNNLLLSIVIPVHNEENRLPEALEKIVPFLQAQSYQAEIIVVENGSEDRTFELAQEYAQKIHFYEFFRKSPAVKGWR